VILNNNENARKNSKSFLGNDNSFILGNQNTGNFNNDGSFLLSPNSMVDIKLEDPTLNADPSILMIDNNHDEKPEDKK
jgi:hypothetical protein